MKKVITDLKELGFSASEIKVYLSLTELGEAKASVIAKKAGFSRTTAIGILDRLVKDSYVTTHKYKGTIYYWIESPAIIKEMFENKAKVANNLYAQLSSLYRADHNFPHGRILDTKIAIKKYIEKILLEIKPNSTIYTIDSPHQGNYRKVLSEEYDKIVLGIKRKKSIKTLTLVPNGSAKSIEAEKLKLQNIVIREMPQGINFESSLWFIDDNMMMFSGKPPFVVSLKHDLIVASMKNIFDFLWQISK